MLYISFDLETGGLNPEVHTIMEAYFSIWDENFNFIDELDLKLKNNDGEIIAEQQALDVTGLTIEGHLDDPDTCTYKEGKIKLKHFLEKNKVKGKKKGHHFRPLGQNIVAFDLPFMFKQNLISESEWKEYCHYNSIDTTNIVTFLKDIDILPSDVGGISSLVRYFNLEMKDAHNAKNDTHMQVSIYQKLRQMLRKNTLQNVNVSVNNDLLKIIEI